MGTITLISLSCSSSASELEPLVLRVEAIPCVGQVNQLATAFVAEPDTLLTVAHTFEDIDRVELRSADGSTVEASVSYIDMAKDIAVLSVEPGRLEANAAASAFDAPLSKEPVTVISFASADGPETKDGQITRLVTATLDGTGKREAMKLDADIDPGDSGAPVIDESGQTVGMIFATERGSDRGWAIAASELADALEKSAAQPEAIDPLGCS